MSVNAIPLHCFTTLQQGYKKLSPILIYMPCVLLIDSYTKYFPLMGETSFTLNPLLHPKV